jgi:hypothetical protein
LLPPVINHAICIFIPDLSLQKGILCVSNRLPQMKYLESGFAMSLRVMQHSLGGKIKDVWILIGMCNIDTLMKKTAQKWW